MNPRSILPVLLLTAVSLQAAPSYSTDGGGGLTTDLFDISQGARVIQTTPVLQFGGEDIREAFGGAGGIENGNAIFQDGPGIGFVDVVTWQTANFINLTGVELRFFQDGLSAARGTAAYNLSATQDGVNYTSISSGAVPLTGGPGSPMANPTLLISDLAPGAGSTNVRGFRLEVTRNSGAGPRFVEIDGMGSLGTQTTNYLDRLAFNASTNSPYTGLAGDDEAPGSATGYSSTPGIGPDDVTEAFGNANGPIEPGDFIFNDGGTPDNGNSIFGDGGEFVDFIAWSTPSPLTLAGFTMSLSGDGGGPSRATELVRFLVEGVEVDLFDNNAFGGDLTRLFAGGAVVGDDFRIEFTRTTNGARIFEIDAILGVVPEPSTTLLGLLGGAMLLRRRR